MARIPAVFSNLKLLMVRCVRLDNLSVVSVLFVALGAFIYQ
jgi:hypothetical protein